MSQFQRLLIGCLFLHFAWVAAAQADTLTAYSEECHAIEQDDKRLACYDHQNAHPDDSAIEQRRADEQEANTNWFAITPHRPNYILPFAHNASADYARYGRFEDLFNDTEIKFQLSLKFPLVEDLPWNSSIDVAYTQQSYWQLYAKESASAPFRETNHEPEIIWQIPLEHRILGFDAKQVSFAFNHQSNGRTEPLSRSWNRLVNQFVFERNQLTLAFRWWLRIEEDSDDDDNPNIEEFMGRFYIAGFYKLNEQSFGVGIRNNARKENRSGVQLDWMFPLTKRLKGYVQLYSGYGENLIDQENYNNRISLGVALTNWL